MAALVAYSRGDLIDRLHHVGEIDSLDHACTVVRGRAGEALAGELASYPAR